jgi:hypothetical protein
LPIGGIGGGYSPPVYTQPVIVPQAPVVNSMPVVVPAPPVASTPPAEVAPTSLISTTTDSAATEVAQAGAVGPVTSKVTEANPADERPLQLATGAALTVEASDLGGSPGQVIVEMDQIAMAASVSEWKKDRVTATLPPLGVASKTKATVFVIRADGSLARNLPIELMPATAATASQTPVNSTAFNAR